MLVQAGYESRKENAGMNRRRWTRKEFLKLSAAAGLASVAPGGSSGAGAAVPPRPNVLFINTDQQRKDTLRCYGNDKVQTPNLDALAARGTLFSSCYTTQPVCSPCRSSMVTGLFPNATGVVENNIPLPASLFAWPRALREAGYQTAYVGKWHLGVDPVPDYFDAWRGYNTGWKHFITEEPCYMAPGETEQEFRKRIERNPPATPERTSLAGMYRPDVETDLTIDFITENKDKPFACWLSFYPPHTPKKAPEENTALYEDTIEPKTQAIYHAMVNRLDWNVGRILKNLDDLGLRENTLVVFTSDHGENYPFRWNKHYKRLCYDQSANVPLIVSWPGVLPEGQRIDKVISVADLCPTLLDLCGMKRPSGLHGHSAKQLLLGDEAGWHEDVFVQNTPYVDKKEKTVPEADLNMRERCVVTDSWKLILNTTREPELYDRRATNPDADNVFGEPNNKAVVRDMVKRLAAWGEKTEDETTARLLSQWSAAWQ